MKIAYDISQTGANKAGCGYYAFSMLNGLLKTNNDKYFTTLSNFGDFYFDSRMAFNNLFKAKNLENGPIFFTKNEADYFWNSINVESLLDYPDIIHSNNFWCPNQLRKTKLIYTFYDCSFLVNPDWTTEKNRMGCFEGALRSSIYADWIIAISEYSKNSYLNFFPHFPENRIKIIYPRSRFGSEHFHNEGDKPEKFNNYLSRNNNFFLTVGTIEPRKNLYMLINAYSKYVNSSNNPMPLIIAGGRGWMMEELITYIKLLELNKHIFLLGYVSDLELVWLYRNCYCNLYPSLYEGFGLPVLEGMQFGAPTIASNTTSIPEIVKDSAILIEPENTSDWTDALIKIENDFYMRNELSLSAKNRARIFELHDSSNILSELYKEIYSKPKRFLNE